MKEPHYAGAQYGEYAIDEEDVHSGDDVNEVDWVRVYRCARPDACMQMPKLEKLPREQTEVMRLMGYTQLKAFVSGIFWQVCVCVCACAGVSGTPSSLTTCMLALPRAPGL